MTCNEFEDLVIETQNEIYGSTTDGTWSYYRYQNPNCKAEWRVKK